MDDAVALPLAARTLIAAGAIAGFAVVGLEGSRRALLPAALAVVVGAWLLRPGWGRPSRPARTTLPWWASRAPWLVLAALAVVGLAVRATPVGPVLGVLFLAGVALLLVGRWARGDGFVQLLLIAAFLARVALLSVDHSLGLFPKLDAAGYHDGAAFTAEAWWRGEDAGPPGSSNVVAFEAFLAPVYFVFGASPLLGGSFNALLGMATVFLVFRVGRLFFPRGAALLGAGFFAFLPNVVQLQGEVLRDTVILLALLLIAYVVLSGAHRTPWGVVAIGAGALVLGTMRATTLLVAVLFLGAAASLALWPLLRERLQARRRGGRARSGLDRHASPLALLVVVGVVGLVIAGAPAGLLPGYALDASEISQARSNWATGGSAYLEDVAFASYWDVLLFLPVGAVYFLFTPFPWQVHNLLALVSAVENLVLFYPVVLLALPAMWALRRDPRAVALLSFLAIGALAFGLIEGNVGTALRHRVQFTWIFFVFAGPALASLWHRFGATPSKEEAAAPEAASRPLAPLT